MKVTQMKVSGNIIDIRVHEPEGIICIKQQDQLFVFDSSEFILLAK